MPGLGTRDSRGERPYIINYVRGDRVLSDSAPTLNAALARISARLAKPHNKSEQAQVYLRGSLVFDTSAPTAAEIYEKERAEALDSIGWFG